jgi:predicted dehydrogenase
VSVEPSTEVDLDLNPVVRLGVLGAARIAPAALIRPAKELTGVRVAAVAARDEDRAESFARKHGIARVHPSYEALLDDPELDAIYNPLPNGLHGAWTIEALRRGKHVLCEKPIAANAAEAERMSAVAAETGRHLVEAFHYRYHPLAARMKEIVDGGSLGRVEHIEASLCIPILRRGDIRFRLELAGGATMDVGCYAIHLVRFLAAAEPEVVRAEARLSSPGVDRCMSADLRFPDGRTGRITGSLFSRDLFRANARVRGDRGELAVLNPVAPQHYHRLKLRDARGTLRQRIAGRATYTHQLEAFAKLLREGTPMATDDRDAIANMRVIDAVYEKAGLPVRQPTPGG